MLFSFLLNGTKSVMFRGLPIATSVQVINPKNQLKSASLKYIISSMDASKVQYKNSCYDQCKLRFGKMH